MMTVGDVEVRYFRESFDQRIISGNAPDGMTDVVVGDKIVKRRISTERIRNQRTDFRPVAVGQEHRTGLRTQNHYVTRAIVFFVAPRALMFANNVAVVLID